METDVLKSVAAGRFTFRRWSDHQHQCFVTAITDDENLPQWFLERVVRRNSKRKRWAVVDRANHPMALYAPKVAGPFSSWREAKAAYITMMALHGCFHPTEEK